MQQTFLSAHRALLKGTEPREPAAWLATIARNECLARIRSRMREPLPTAALEGQASSADPVDEAIRRADLAALQRAIAELPRQQRDALLLREFGGLSYAELAAALAVSGSAVESLLFRARQGLRDRLQTVYAAVSGVGWLEPLVRLLAGGSAPVAAKAVAVGVSAAVVTGGAVVGPRVLEHRHGPRVEQANAVGHRRAEDRAVEHRAVEQQAVEPVRAPRAPVLLVRTRATTPAVSGGRGSEAAHEGSDAEATASPEHRGERERGAAAPTRVERSSRDGNADSGDGGGDAASGDSAGGGIAVTAPNPSLTVSVPDGADSSGDDPSGGSPGEPDAGGGD